MAEGPGRVQGDPPTYSPGAQAQAGDAGRSDDAIDQLLDDPGTEWEARPVVSALQGWAPPEKAAEKTCVQL